ncbi:MAG: long-chain acyl-CoA synthetase [Myxococcota bacterium]|jgi:long-chain acyl-CoA synthetase
MFFDCVDRAPKRVLAHIPQPDGEGWRWDPVTLAEIESEVSGLARRLAALGVEPGSPVAIVAETSHLWAACDLAILCLGGITVGLYPTLTGEQLAWQLAHSGAEILIVQGQGVLDALGDRLENLDDLRHTFSLTDGADVPQLFPARPDIAFLRAQAAAVTPEQIATYVYTSGTTGSPKAVVLTHHNFVANVASSQEALPAEKGDRMVIYLPLAHSLQRFAQYRGLVEEGEGWYAPGLDALPQTIAAARPTVLPVVPRVLEKIVAKASRAAAARGPISSGMLRWAIAVGRTVCDHRDQGTPLPRRLALQHALAERLVYPKIRARLGGELRLIVSGGAALSVDVAMWFEAIGIAVREGWGLTETCAPATLSRLDAHRPGSIGPAMPGVEVAVSKAGELLVRGPGVFSGYLNDPTSTAAAFTADGFFRTGDLGTIDADGFATITGRIKEIIVTAGGKNIAPVPIEQRLTGGLFEAAVVIGDNRPYLTALMVPDEDALTALAAAEGWSGGFLEWSQQSQVQSRAEAVVAQANAALARFQTIKQFVVLSAPLTVEGGELTATLKKRRAAITKKYARQIEAMYG